MFLYVADTMAHVTLSPQQAIDLAAAVRAARIARNLTQTEAAEQFGVSLATWVKVEKGDETTYQDLKLGRVRRILEPDGPSDDLTERVATLERAVLTLIDQVEGVSRRLRDAP